MAAAGASQEDIEEMMAMIMSAGSGGISEDFLMAIKEAMSSGGKVFFNLLIVQKCGRKCATVQKEPNNLFS